MWTAFYLSCPFRGVSVTSDARWTGRRCAPMFIEDAIGFSEFGKPFIARAVTKGSAETEASHLGQRYAEADLARWFILGFPACVISCPTVLNESRMWSPTSTSLAIWGLVIFFAKSLHCCRPIHSPLPLARLGSSWLGIGWSFDLSTKRLFPISLVVLSSHKWDHYLPPSSINATFRKKKHGWNWNQYVPYTCLWRCLLNACYIARCLFMGVGFMA